MTFCRVKAAKLVELNGIEASHSPYERDTVGLSAAAVAPRPAAERFQTRGAFGLGIELVELAGIEPSTS